MFAQINQMTIKTISQTNPLNTVIHGTIKQVNYQQFK